MDYEQGDFKFVLKELKNIISSSYTISDKTNQSQQKHSIVVQEQSVQVKTKTQIIDQCGEIGALFNSIIQLAPNQVLIMQAYQSQKYSIYIYQTLYNGTTFEYLKTQHIILHQMEEEKSSPLVTIGALIPINLGEIGILMGTSQGQLVRFLSGTVRHQYISGTGIIDIQRMSPQFQDGMIDGLCVVGFEDHQINIFDYDRFINLWVFKEGFTIPAPQKFVRAHMNNQFILGAGEDGSVTFWQISNQINESLMQYRNSADFMKVENGQINTDFKAYPKFDVVPISKICHIHRTPLKFIEFYGHLIASLETDGTFRIWYMEHTLKQYLNIWKLQIEDQIIGFSLNEEYQLIFMNSLEKCFVMGIPSSEKGDFQCRVLNNVEEAQNVRFDFNSNVLSWITQKDNQVSSGAKILQMDMDLVELDY